MLKQGPTIEVRACKTIRLLDDRTTLKLEPGDSIKVCEQPRSLKLHVCDAPEPPPLVFYTSKPYPVMSIEEFTAQGSVDRMRLLEKTEEEYQAQGVITTINLRTLLQTYDDGLPEELESQGTLTSIELRQTLLSYDNWNADDEELTAQGELTTINLKRILIEYNNWPEESLEAQGSITRIELT